MPLPLSSPQPAPRAGALLLALVAGLGACGEAPAAPPVAAAPRKSARDPELEEVRTVLEKGRGDLGLALLERVQGFEAECLRARAEVLRGDPVAALKALDRARALDANDPELAATEIEILVAQERLPAAGEALAAAFRRSGPSPALLRAQGVLELRTPGHAPRALEALERARAGDPELPFLRRPLAQAHLLVGRGLLDHQPAEATAHARAALGLWPALEDALELEAEALAGELRFEEAIARYEELEARGRTFGETPALLHQRCATRCLLERDRAGAVRHYAAARRRGLRDEALGFGAEVLREERAALLDRGAGAAEAEDWPGAAAAFVEALALDPDDLEAEDRLAVVRFQLGEYRAAAEGWARVVAAAERGRIELRDPVALNLAKAWRLAGEREKARTVLSHLIDADPDGRWSEDARELLVVLEAEDLAGR